MLSEYEILEELNAITDDMAFDSEDGGDSDAEDYATNTNNSLSQQVWHLSTRSSGSSMAEAEVQVPSVANIEQTYNNIPSTSHDIHNDLKLIEDIISSSDEEMDDTDKDKDYVPTQQQQLLGDLDEVNIDDLPIDVNMFLNNDYLENELINVEEDNVSNANISNEFNFIKSGLSPKKFKEVRFREEQGPVDQNIYKMPPIDIFQLMIGPIFQTIVQQTNLYGQQNNVNINTSIEEMKAFIGILIFMGYHSLPSIRLYWSNDPNFFCERVAKIMPVKRFLKILRFLHLNDNSQMPPRNSLEFDKLYKIRPIITQLKNIYQSVYRPSRYLAVDESMVAYKGRSTMKQYMPMKPIKNDCTNF